MPFLAQSRAPPVTYIATWAECLATLRHANSNDQGAYVKKRPSSFRLPIRSFAPTAMHPIFKTSAAVSLGLSTLLLLPAMGSAAPAAKATEAEGALKQFPRMDVLGFDPNPNGEVGVPYKAKTSGDQRHTRPLAELPQTITVITQDAINDSGMAELRAILDGQPGITVGTGENGNAFGDRYVIRGQEARSDVFVDGLRDPGMTTRESFAIEQLEISKGPNSSFAGRGTSGGAINAITKQATTDYNFATVSTGVGTDDHLRVTADANQVFNENIAVRANIVYGDEDVPDRGPAFRQRKGVALSGLYTNTENFDLHLDYYGLHADENPDLGSFLIGTLPNRKPAKNVPVYAQEQDFLKSDVDTGTARFEYRFNPAVRLSNLTRYGTSDNGYVMTGARFSSTGANNPGGIYTTATLSTHQGWQDVEYLANQTNLFFNPTIAGREHAFVFGLEYTDHSVLNGIYKVTNSGQNCSTGNSASLNAWCAIGSDGRAVPGINNIMNRQIVKGTWDTDWNVKTTSLSVLDTFDLNDDWTLFAGLRGDHFNFDLLTQNTNTLAQAHYDYDDTLINGQFGLTRKVGDGGIVYISAATASDINGGESDVGTSSGYGGTVIFDGQVAGADPEQSVNLELGTKWNVLNDKLLMTAALFQTTKSDVMEGADYSAVGTFNTGKNRVRGVELGLTGNITERLTGQVGVTVMDSEVLESATANNVGKVLSNFADNSASAQLKYQFSDNFYAGGAVRYESERFAGQPDTAAGYNSDGQYTQPVPAYTVADLFASYRVNPNLETRLNIGNVTNEDYYLAAYRSGSFLYKGDARTYRLTVIYDF